MLCLRANSWHAVLAFSAVSSVPDQSAVDQICIGLGMVFDLYPQDLFENVHFIAGCSLCYSVVSLPHHPLLIQKRCLLVCPDDLSAWVLVRLV